MSANDKNFVFNNKNYTRLSFSFYTSFILIFISLVSMIIASVALYLAMENKNKDTLYLKGQNDSILASSNSPRNLFTYYTENNDRKLKKYQGQYEIILSNSTDIIFTVTDQSGHNLTGDVISQGPNIATIVKFKSSNNISQIKLNYETSRSDIILYRVDIVLD